MKSDILEADNKFQLGGKPGMRGQFHLVVLKGRFSIRTSISQLKSLCVVINLHFVSLLWVEKYQIYLTKPVWFFFLWDTIFKWPTQGSHQKKSFCLLDARRYGPLRVPPSSSCWGLWPSAAAKNPNHAVLANFRPFSVVI